MAPIDLSGQTFGSLTVLRRTPAPRHNGEAGWLCRCVCGTEKAFRSDKLRGGRAKSCGCLNPVGKPIHGMWNTPEYNIWRGMRGRCHNKRDNRYKYYGERGIEVRFSSFEQFFSEVGARPSARHSIDRIDNNGHYEPGNVRWATRQEQDANKRKANQYLRPKRKPKTRCIRGHEFTPENTIIHRNNRRVCLKCDYIRRPRKQKSLAF